MPKAQQQSNTYDVIIIGSGMGGLTAASLLAQLGRKRVLVLERHFKLGGYTHTFERKGYSWDVGLHYVGQMGQGSQFRQLFDLITGGKVRWNRMPPIYERFVYPGLNFGVPDSREAYAQALAAEFPNEAAAVRQYFVDIERVNGWFNRHVMGKLFPRPVAAALALPGRQMALQTTQQYLDEHFADARLKALLASQWGDYGLPPAQSAFAIHALIVSQYLDGGYYPKGGAGVIADSIIPIIEAAGGACLVNHEVCEILLRDGKAVGVRVRGRGGKPDRKFFAPVIISDAGAYTTYHRLLPQGGDLPQRRDLETILPPQGAVTLFVGFHDSPAKLGFQGENHWIYASYDHSAIYRDRNQVVNGRPSFAYVSFASLRDPQASRHTAQIITWADHACFAPWQDQSWKHRDDAYETLKQVMADGLIDLVEAQYPGFRDLIAHIEVATPLTSEHFTGHRLGASYGVPATPQRFSSSAFEIRTPIPGLLLTGADVVSLGINGAMMGGVMTSAFLLGSRGFFQITGAARAAALHPAG